MNKRKQMCFNIPLEIHKALKVSAAKRSISVTNLLLIIIYHSLALEIEEYMVDKDIKDN